MCVVKNASRHVQRYQLSSCFLEIIRYFKICGQYPADNYLLVYFILPAMTSFSYVVFSGWGFRLNVLCISVFLICALCSAYVFILHSTALSVIKCGVNSKRFFTVRFFCSFFRFLHLRSKYCSPGNYFKYSGYVVFPSSQRRNFITVQSMSLDSPLVQFQLFLILTSRCDTNTQK